MVLHNKSSLKFDFALKMIILRQKSQNPQNFTKGAKLGRYSVYRRVTHQNQNPVVEKFPTWFMNDS